MPTSRVRLTAIGGGTGLASLLRGLKTYVDAEGPWSISELSAIVTMTDDGGSSGALRREFSVLPPGDVRNCIVALAEEETMLSQLLNYRFELDSALGGHSLGNLLLTALTELRGSFLQAIREISEILAIRGSIYPSTLEDVRVRALCADGSLLEGETAIGGDRLSGTLPPGHDRIVRLEIEPADAEPVPEAIQAILGADIVVIGPGSLYTSVLPNLRIEKIREALTKTEALKVYICNVMTQPGETDGYRAADHLRAILEHSGLIVNAMIVNGRRPAAALLERYREMLQIPVECDREEILQMGVTPFFGDIIAEADFLRHDPGALAATIFRWYERYGRRRQKKRMAETDSTSG